MGAATHEKLNNRLFDHYVKESCAFGQETSEEDGTIFKDVGHQSRLPQLAPYICLQFAERISRGGLDQELLGHSFIESSERYAKLSNQHIKRMYLNTIKKVIDKTRV